MEKTGGVKRLAAGVVKVARAGRGRVMIEPIGVGAPAFYERVADSVAAVRLEDRGWQPVAGLRSFSGDSPTPAYRPAPRQEKHCGSNAKARATKRTANDWFVRARGKWATAPSRTAFGQEKKTVRASAARFTSRQAPKKAVVDPFEFVVKKHLNRICP